VGKRHQRALSSQRAPFFPTAFARSASIWSGKVTRSVNPCAPAVQYCSTFVSIRRHFGYAGLVSRLRQCDKENQGWREGPPLTVSCQVPIRGGPSPSPAYPFQTKEEYCLLRLTANPPALNFGRYKAVSGPGAHAIGASVNARRQGRTHFPHANFPFGDSELHLVPVDHRASCLLCQADHRGAVGIDGNDTVGKQGGSCGEDLFLGSCLEPS
jgi:hypothetical protein